MQTKNKPKKHHASMRAASALMGVPISILKWAKRQAAPGFVGSRVYPDALLPWLAENQPADDDPVLNKAAAILARINEQVRNLRRQNDEQEAKLINRGWVHERMGLACSTWIQCRQDGKDVRCLALSAERGVPVAALRTLYDQVTSDGGEVLRSLGEVFRE